MEYLWEFKWRILLCNRIKCGFIISSIGSLNELGVFFNSPLSDSKDWALLNFRNPFEWTKVPPRKFSQEGLSSNLWCLFFIEHCKRIPVSFTCLLPFELFKLTTGQWINRWGRWLPELVFPENRKKNVPFSSWWRVCSWKWINQENLSAQQAKRK